MFDFIKKFFLYPAYGGLRRKSAFGLYFLIVVLGAIPGVRTEAGEIASGFILHSLAYSTIAYLLFTGASTQSFAKAVHAFLWVVVMGAADEFIQSFFPYRNGRVQDWLVDMGAALVMLCILMGHGRRYRCEFFRMPPPIRSERKNSLWRMICWL